jgi:hypothetical protein
VVEYLPPHSKVKGLSLTSTTSTAREKIARKRFNKQVSGNTTVVEHLPPHLEVKGLSSTTTTSTTRVKMTKHFIKQVSGNTTVV